MWREAQDGGTRADMLAVLLVARWPWPGTPHSSHRPYGELSITCRNRGSSTSSPPASCGSGTLGSSRIADAPPRSPNVGTSSRCRRPSCPPTRAARRAPDRRTGPAVLSVLPRRPLGPRRAPAPPRATAIHSRAARLLMIPPHDTTHRARSQRGRRLATVLVCLRPQNGCPPKGSTAAAHRCTPPPGPVNARPRPFARERLAPSTTPPAIQSP